jgi:hypothetical protein
MKREWKREWCRTAKLDSEREGALWTMGRMNKIKAIAQ